jgi:hypothetical protein
MSLVNELKERREAVANRLEDAYVSTETLRAELDDLDRAIAALEPTELVVTEITKEDAASQLRDEWLSANSELATVEKRAAQLTVHMEDIERGISALGSFVAEDDAILFDDEPAPEPGYAAADPVVADAYAAEIISELTGDPAIEPESGLHGEAVTEEGYAPVTNPEADAIAQAQDWYSPEQVAEREKASRSWSGLGTLWGKPKVDA